MYTSDKFVISDISMTKIISRKNDLYIYTYHRHGFNFGMKKEFTDKNRKKVFKVYRIIFENNYYHYFRIVFEAVSRIPNDILNKHIINYFNAGIYTRNIYSHKVNIKDYI